MHTSHTTNWIKILILWVNMYDRETCGDSDTINSLLFPYISEKNQIELSPVNILSAAPLQAQTVTVLCYCIA